MEAYNIIRRLERHRKIAYILTRFILIGILAAFVAMPIMLGVVAPAQESVAEGRGDTIKWVCCGLFFLFLIVSPFAASINNKALERLNKEYKELVLSKIMPVLPEGITYDPEGGFTLEEFIDTHVAVLPMREGYTYTCESEDSLAGSYNGKQFKQSDIKVTRIVKRQGQSPEKAIIIDGVLTCFEYKTTMKQNVSIMSHMPLNVIAPDFHNLAHVHMEDLEFNEMFDIFASDAHYAYYILTPHFMEHLKELYGKTNGRLYLRFDGDHLYMVRDVSGGIFSPPPLSEKITMQEVIRRSKDDIKYIFKTIDILQMGEEGNTMQIQ